MVDPDDTILARLRTDFGRDWTISRTPFAGTPRWWKAVRHEGPTRRQTYKGCAKTLIQNTPAELRAALVAEAELMVRIGPDPVGYETTPAWNPAYL